MRIGYPCINRGIGCSSGRTFRLRSYSEARMETTVEANLSCLAAILRYNAAHSLRFFRITSDLVPFASHPVCRYPWQRRFGEVFREIGRFIQREGIRISMHPDQFTLINTPDREVLRRSLAELEYHAQVLDLMGLDATARIQIHVGGVYGDRSAAMERFTARYGRLDGAVRRRLVIENDDRLYSLGHCMELYSRCGVPVLFDWFHHRINGGEPPGRALAKAASTWKSGNGIPMCDYSSQKPGARAGTHAESIDREDFRAFLDMSRGHDFDLMLEIKDKEASAAVAVEEAWGDDRFVP
ncbi:MAG: UV DNA damage repair endonuclease UvsE [Spirochaetes bacterium]|nr:UV DNA damage repair endonuclease UvsE [Spirochaetota bacterium]